MADRMARQASPGAGGDLGYAFCLLAGGSAGGVAAGVLAGGSGAEAQNRSGWAVLPGLNLAWVLLGWWFLGWRQGPGRKR